MNSVKKAFGSQVIISDHFYWTDSIVSWIKAFDKEYKTFVQNRLNEIRELSNIEKWNYVKINSNPADMLTKFFKKNVENIFNTNILFKDESNELKTTAVNIATSSVYSSISHIINIENFSSFTKLMRVTS